MVERTNRRDMIIAEASRLFVEQGYAATSVRQIAEAVGCTEAALYYHFKEGKRELLQAVIECNIPDLLHAVDECSAAPSLHDFVLCFMRRMVNKAQKHMVSQLRWIFTEFPNLTDEERLPLYEQKCPVPGGAQDPVSTVCAGRSRGRSSDMAAHVRLFWLRPVNDHFEPASGHEF